LVLTQQTNYPWDGRVQFTIDQCPGNEFALKLRIPGWAESATIRVNGSLANVAITPATYATIRRRWQPGDVVELQLPMSARLIEANPLVEETRNQVAIRRGPIVYCLESPDLPKVVRVQDIAVQADAELTARYEPNLLGGVEVIEAKVLVRPSGDWSDKLYRPLRRAPERHVKVRLIPYCAWSNRGPSEMT
jgi:DUF1680 family protein